MTVEKISPPEQITIEFFEKRGNKTTKLVGNRDPANSLKSRSFWYSFELKEPALIVKLDLQTEGFSSSAKIEFEFELVEGGSEKVDARSRDGTIFTAECGFFTRRFRFRPPSSILSERKLNGLQIIGYTLSSIKSLEAAVISFDKEKEKLDAQEARIAAEQKKLDENISASEQTLEQIEGEIQEKAREQSALLDEISRTESKLTNLKSAVKDREEALQRTAQELENTNKKLQSNKSELSETTEKLRVVKQEVRLFPSEIADFVKEGGRSIRNYLIYSTPFVAILGYTTYYLYTSAFQFLRNLSADISVWDQLIVRLPFVAVSIAILQGCIVILKRLLEQIIAVNNQRLSMSKLSIIARDVSTASSNGLSLSDDEKHEYETALKMDLLRSYMRNYIGDDYKYEPKALQKIKEKIDSLSNDKGDDESEAAEKAS